MLGLTVGISVMALLVASAAAWGAFRLSTEGFPDPTPPYDDRALREALVALQEALETQGDQIERLQADYKSLVVAVDEGIQDVKRRENRIRASIRRAQEELEEHGVQVPSIEAEAAEIRQLDGEGSPDQGVPPVREDLAELRSALAAVPGGFTPEEIGG